jgi:uncharacterized protein
MPDKPEFLSIALADAELRADDEGQPKLIGYASKFGNWYPVGGFLERIQAGAFDEVLRDKETDVVASMNHDVNFAFARQSAGTLRLRSNSVGLQYEADITDDDGRRVHAKVKNGTIQGSSFMFSDVDDVWEFKEAEPPRRTVTRIGRLYELGPVVWPANAQATVKARADEILAEARQRHTPAPEPPAAVPPVIAPERQVDLDRQWRAALRRQQRNDAALNRLKQAKA